MSASQRRREVVRQHDQVVRWAGVVGRFPEAGYRRRADGFFEGSLRAGEVPEARADLRGLINALLAREDGEAPA